MTGRCRTCGLTSRLKTHVSPPTCTTCWAWDHGLDGDTRSPRDLVDIVNDLASGRTPKEFAQ